MQGIRCTFAIRYEDRITNADCRTKKKKKKKSRARARVRGAHQSKSVFNLLWNGWSRHSRIPPIRISRSFVFTFVEFIAAGIFLPARHRRSLRASAVSFPTLDRTYSIAPVIGVRRYRLFGSPRLVARGTRYRTTRERVVSIPLLYLDIPSSRHPSPPPPPPPPPLPPPPRSVTTSGDRIVEPAGRGTSA